MILRCAIQILAEFHPEHSKPRYILRYSRYAKRTSRKTRISRLLIYRLRVSTSVKVSSSLNAKVYGLWLARRAMEATMYL